MRKKLKAQELFSLTLVSILLVVFLTPMSFGSQKDGSEVILVPINYTTSDQVVTVLNKSGEKLDLSGFRIKAGEGKVFEFPSTEPIWIDPFGVLKVHSGEDASEDYSAEEEFYWTNEDIWRENRTARLINPEGEVIFTMELSRVDEVDQLAGCLTRNEVRLYGLKTCPHCISQKEEFGSAVEYLSYLECTKNRKRCIEDGIRSVPAWVKGDKDKIAVGKKSLDRISELAGCNYHD